MDTHNDPDFEMGGAAEEGPGPDDQPRREQRTEGDERAESAEPERQRSEREDRGDDDRDGCRGGRHRRHRRHRHHGRKERVLHTRVSEQLSDDIRRLAEDLRVPASNLVRNVLEEVFTVVESVTDDMGDLFEDVLEEAEGARDRLRERERRGGRRHGRRRSRSRSRRDSDPDSEVEAELRDDEQREAKTRDGRRGERVPGAGAPNHAQDEAPAPEPEPAFPDVLGWQPLVLNHARTCARCGVDLARGHRGFIGLTANGLSDVTLCRACVGS